MFFTHSPSRVLATVFSLASVCVARATANVLVVDANGGGTYTQIQAAVDAAYDGDTILVKTGSYAWFSVTNKALAIAGDSGSDVEISGPVSLRNLAASKTLVIENLNATGIHDASAPHLGYGLSLTNNPGHVPIESCQVRRSTSRRPHRCGKTVRSSWF